MMGAVDLELSLKFGRIINDKGKINDINDNVQDDDDRRMDERQSRKEFRKWDIQSSYLE